MRDLEKWAVHYHLGAQVPPAWSLDHQDQANAALSYHLPIVLVTDFRLFFAFNPYKTDVLIMVI